MDEPLLGINPDETKEVRARGAVIVVGVVDRAAWESLRARASDAFLQVYRRKVKEIADAGGDPAAPADPADAKGPTRAEIATVEDEEFQARSRAGALEIARLAVRGHSGIVDRTTRQPVEFQTVEERTPWGEVRRVVSPATLRWYDVNGLLGAVATAARELNGLGAAEKKG